MAKGEESTMMGKIQSIDDFLALLKGVKQPRDGQYLALCPGHHDTKPSLSAKEDDGKILVQCFAGCELNHILKPLGLEPRDLFLNSYKTKPQDREIEVVYRYTDINGKPFEVVRTRPKGFYQRRLDGKGGYTNNLKGIVPTLYHQDKLPQAIDSATPIYFVEGEKDTDMLWSLGLIATTNPMGAGKWRAGYSEALRGADLVIIPDNDGPGYDHANKVARSCHGIAKRIRLLELPGEAKDISHWLDNGGDIQQLLKLATECSSYELPPVAVTGVAFRLTDLGNAERLVHQFGEILHYCYERKRWMIWSGEVWEWDMGDKIMQLATKTVRSIYHEAGDEPDDNRRKELIDHAKRSESDQRLKAMIEQAKARPGIPIDVEELNKDAWLLNCNNGTINLKTGNLQPHNTKDLITMLIPLDYDPEARSEEWNNFLATIFKQKESLICYVQKALGYSITGSQAEQAFFFNHGSGWNGKSTLLGAIIDILGSYAQEIEPEAFMVKHGSGGPNESIADLFQKRLVCSTEVEDGQRLSVTLIKRMTGGEKLRHERKYEHGFNFLPCYKLWLSGNHEPTITDTTNSIWNRLKRIPFKVSISEEKRIKDYRHILSGNHGKVIFAWLVEGCIQWQKLGLGEPPEVLEAIKQYREEQDLLYEFLNECCVLQSSSTIKVADFYKAYKQWCDENESYCIGKNTFGARLKEKGILSARGPGNKAIWQGIKLLTEEEKVNLGNKVTAFHLPFLYEGDIEEKGGEVVTKVTKVTDDIPDYPINPCSCGCGDYWLTDDNRWLCLCCHPKLEGEK